MFDSFVHSDYPEKLPGKLLPDLPKTINEYMSINSSIDPSEDSQVATKTSKNEVQHYFPDKIEAQPNDTDNNLNNRIRKNTTRKANPLDYTIIVIITNTLVVLATFIATVYRIKIERDQIQTVKRNVQAKECLQSLRKYIKAERNSISHMNEQELKEFLDYLEKLGEC